LTEDGRNPLSGNLEDNQVKACYGTHRPLRLHGALRIVITTSAIMMTVGVTVIALDMTIREGDTVKKEKAMATKS
jgi:hypothetical protein